MPARRGARSPCRCGRSRRLYSSASAERVLAALRDRQRLGAPVLLLVAHPDDEVLGASILLSLADKLHLVHATNGAPGGVEDQAALSETRFAELKAALLSLGAVPDRATRLDFPDGDIVHHVHALAAALLPIVEKAEIVVTHAFEGGHPDHDACALALHMACERAALLKSHRPYRLEFALYAVEGGRIVTNSFPANEAPTVLVLTDPERAMKARALAAYQSQRAVVEQFPLLEEQLRAVPSHDFFKPRQPACTLFAVAEPEREQRWRQAAAAPLTLSDT